MPDRMPDRMLESDRLSEYMPDRMSEYVRQNAR